MAQPIGAPIGRTANEIAQQLEENERSPDLGYSLYAVLPDESIGVDIRDGIWSKYNPPNRVFVEFEGGLSEELVELLTTDRLSRMLISVVEIFHPDWGGVETRKHLEMVGLMGTVPYASWMLYLPRRVEELPPLPSGVEVRPVGESGVLIVTVQERFLVNNPDHVRLAAEITNRLTAAGILSEPKEEERVKRNDND